MSHAALTYDYIAYNCFLSRGIYINGCNQISSHRSEEKPFYHFVATDKRNKRDGRFIEQLGYFNPYARGEAVRLNLNMKGESLGRVAQLSEKADLLVKEFKKGPESRQAFVEKNMLKLNVKN